MDLYNHSSSHKMASHKMAIGDQRGSRYDMGGVRMRCGVSQGMHVASKS